MSGSERGCSCRARARAGPRSSWTPPPWPGGAGAGGGGLELVPASTQHVRPGQGGVVRRTLGPEATALRMVADLDRLVSIVQQLERPLVLVGAELDGLVARLYTQLH